MLLLLGCVEIRATQYFFPNGRSHIVQQIEISGLLDVLNTSGLSWNNQTGFEAWDDLANYSCDAVRRYEPGASCHRSLSWMLIDQDRVSDVDYVFKSYSQFPYIIYEVTLLRPPAIPSAAIATSEFLPNISGMFFANATVEKVAALKGAGMRYSYKVVMPGEIYNHSAGALVDGGLEFDVLSQAMSRSNVNIKSRTPDWEQITIAIIFALDLLLFIDVGGIWLINFFKRHKQQIERLRQDANEKAESARQIARRTKLKGYDVYSYEQGDSISKIEAAERAANAQKAANAERAKSDKSAKPEKKNNKK